MRKKKYSVLFAKKVRKLKGQEARNLLQKRDEILSCEDISHYKNLKHDLSEYKRVHGNDSYVILFFGDDNIVYFIDYEHHDVVYKHSKKQLKKYKGVEFE